MAAACEMNPASAARQIVKASLSDNHLWFGRGAVVLYGREFIQGKRFACLALLNAVELADAVELSSRS